MIQSVAKAEEGSVGMRCARCKAGKLFLEFPTDTKKKNGVSSWCKACVREANAARYNSKRQAKGDDLFLAMSKDPRDDMVIAGINRRAYAKRKKKTCAFAGCDTRLRYRSAYAPYCEKHGTPAKREEAEAQMVEFS